MSRNFDLVRMTSSSSGTPFTPSPVTGFNSFEDFFEENEAFIVNIKDSNDNYATGWAHLDSSNNVVVDEYLFTSTGPTDNTEPTFSGTVDLVLGSASANTQSFRPNMCMITSSGYLDGVICDASGAFPTQSYVTTADILHLCSIRFAQAAWAYQFYVWERAVTTGNYRVAVYDIGSDGYPKRLIAATASVAHGNADADVFLDFDDTLTITGITQANPAVVTYTGTDPTDGQRIYITDVVGMTEVNDLSFVIQNVNAGANTFELKGINSSAYTAYSSGGTVHFPRFFSPGEYVLAWVTDAAIGFRGYSTTQMALGRWVGLRSGFSPNTLLYKSFTYAAIPQDPMATGAWTDSNSTALCVALNRVKD